MSITRRFFLGLTAGLVTGSFAGAVTYSVDRFQAYWLPVALVVAAVTAILVWFGEFLIEEVAAVLSRID